MAYGFDIVIIIKATLENLLQVKISLIFYTDLKFLYNCLVKLKTTQKTFHNRYYESLLVV